jgi:hypothetical protein
MVYPKSVKVAIINAIADLDAVNQTKDNSENIRLLSAAEAKVKEALGNLKEFMERK